MWSNGKSYDEIKKDMGNDDLFKSITLQEISNPESSEDPQFLQARVW